MKSHRCLQVSSILGCWFIVLPNGTRWLWGNLTVYTSSYLYAHGGHDATEATAPWMPSISMAAWAVGIFLSGPVIKGFGRFGAHLFGIFVFDGGIFLSYLSVNLNSVTALNVAFGAATGIGDGIIGTTIILVVSECVDKRQGLTICVVFSSAILGSMANNQFATWYINPLNLHPDVDIGPGTFFSQRSVIQKVPSFFLILLFFSMFFHLLGMTLIRHYKDGVNIRKCANFSCYKSHNRTSEQEETDFNEASDTTETVGCTEDISARLSPRQLLLTPTFHALWVGSSCSELTKVWLFNYYKIFGLFFIPDDHFLTNLGTAMAVVAALARSFWGWSADCLGLKPTIIFCTASMALITDFYFFTPIVNQWLYGLCTLVYGTTISGYSILEALVIIRMYGKTNFSANYGLMCLPTIATNLLAPFMFQSLLDHWGWFPMLFTMSIMNTISMLALVLLVPHHAA